MASSTATLSNSLISKVEVFGSSFGFLVPVVIPWMQQLCSESATVSMRMLYELPESTIPSHLIPRTSLKFERIRDCIIPQLFKFINSTRDANQYLRDRFNYYYTEQKKENDRYSDAHKQEQHDSDDSSSSSSQHSKQLTERRLELFISSLVSDLITFDHYQRNANDSENEHLKDLLPLDVSVIIQYIKMLIWEYHKSILNSEDNDAYIYNESLCCNSLLTILNHEYTHHLLIERHNQNISDFAMFAEYLHENALALSKFKKTNQINQNHVTQLQHQIHELKKEKVKKSIRKRPSSQSLPQRGQKPSEQPESPLPTINRLDILVHQLPPPAPQPPTIMWQPLEEMYELFEPRHKRDKKFQRIRESESIPPPPKHGLPGFTKNKTPPKYKIIPKGKSSPKILKPKPNSPPPVINLKTLHPPNVILPLPPRANKPKTLHPQHKHTINGPSKSEHRPKRNDKNRLPPSPGLPRRIRTMTLSRPAKLESLSKDEFMGKYLVEGSKIIGQGSFAKIYRCKKKNQDTILAMKIVKKQKANKDDVRAMRREISALALVYHEHVIRIHDWCETTQHIFIVLDYCGGGNVFDRVMELQTFTEIQASKLIKQVAEALTHIHSLGIVHRDLKPENLMYTGPHHDQLKVIDFGLSNRIKINGMFLSETDLKKKNIVPEMVFSLTTPCGTPHYAAPELIKNQKYGSPVDLWALGVIIYMLLCGFPPFFDTNIKNMFYQIQKAKFHFPSPFWDHISPTAKDLITRLLVVDATKRYTAAQTLKHPWITGYFADNAQEEIMPIGHSLPIPPPGPQPPSCQPIQNDTDTNATNHNAPSHTPSPRQIFIPKNKNKQSMSRRSDAPSASSPVLYGSHERVSNRNMDTMSESSVVIYKPTSSNASSAMNGDANGVYGTPIVEHVPHSLAVEENKAPQKQKPVLIQSQSIGDPHSLSNPPVPFHVESELFTELEDDGMSDELKQKNVNHRRALRKAQSMIPAKNLTGRMRVDTRGVHKVAYMVDGTIFQIQKKQINKLKLEIQQEQQNLEKLSNQLQKERRVFREEREKFERDQMEWDKRKAEWMNEHEHLMKLKFELNDVVNKFLPFKN